MRNGALAAALVAHAVLATLYLRSTPAFEAPDEYLHLDYAFQIAHAGDLPVMDFTSQRLGRLPSDQNGLAHHPPLYYALLAATMAAAGRADTLPSFRFHEGFADPDPRAPGRNLRYLHGADERPPVSSEMKLFRALRGWSVLCGLATLLLVHRLGRLAFPGKPRVADGAVLLLACLPTWSFMHGVLDTGNLATVFCHATLMVLAARAVDGRLDARRGAGIGLLVGLALLSKLTSLALVPLAAAVHVRAWWRARHDRGARRAVLLSALAAAGVALALSGWFFARNLRLYGDLFALQVHREAFAVNAIPEGEALGWVTGGFLPAVFSSLLGHFGYGAVPPPDRLVAAGGVAVVLALLGLAATWRVRRGGAGAQPSPSAVEPRALAVALGGGLLVFLLVLRFNLVFRQPQGRYLFPGIGPLVLVVTWGLHEFAARLPAATRRAAALVGWGAPPVLALLAHAAVFLPAMDPEAAPAPPWHASFAGDITRATSVRGIDLLEPADGSRLSGRPVLRWSRRAPATDPAPLYTVHMFTEGGRILLATYEWLHLEVREERLALSERFWEYVPPGVTVRWTVQEVADRSLGQAPADMPGSGVSSFTRVVDG